MIGENKGYKILKITNEALCNGLLQPTHDFKYRYTNIPDDMRIISMWVDHDRNILKLKVWSSTWDNYVAEAGEYPEFSLEAELIE